MKLNVGKPNLVWGRENFVIDDQPVGRLPLLTDRENRPVLVASNWLRHLATSGKVSQGSVEQYAKTIRNFWGFIEDNHLQWTNVSDRTLKLWRNRDRFTLRLDKRTCNNKLSVVYRFYLWAQSESYVSGIIGSVDWLNGTQPPITIQFRSQDGNSSMRYGRRNGGQSLTSDLLFRVSAKPTLHVPTAEEMDRVYVELSNVSDEDLAVRNTLLLNWAELEGLRRAEILSLRCSDIPGWEDIYRLQDEDAVYPLRIVGKGEKVRVLPITHKLLATTRDYIDGERTKVLNRLKREDSGDIFISHRSGRALSVDYVTNFISAAFKGAQVGATLHRTRARFLSRIVEESLGEAVEKFGLNFSHETVLLKASEAAGHSNLATLRYYLNIHLKRLAKHSDAGRVHVLQEKELLARRALDHSSLRLQGFDAARDLAKALRGHDPSQIKTALADLNEHVQSLIEEGEMQRAELETGRQGKERS
jgi:integrase